VVVLEHVRPLSPKAEVDTAPALETLARLEQAISLRLGALQGGVKPLLLEAREHCTVLAPSPGGQRPPPKEQQERLGQLAEVLDQMEDVLEALYLAVRSGSGVTVSREDQR
jgi:hypothetical protein